MKLLTLNFITCAVKTCKAVPSSYPLHPRDAEVARDEMEFNPQVIINLVPRLDWDALRTMATEASYLWAFFFFKKESCQNLLLRESYLRHLYPTPTMNPPSPEIFFFMFSLSFCQRRDRKYRYICFAWKTLENSSSWRRGRDKKKKKKKRKGNPTNLWYITVDKKKKSSASLPAFPPPCPRTKNSRPRPPAPPRQKKPCSASCTSCCSKPTSCRVSSSAETAVTSTPSRKGLRISCYRATWSEGKGGGGFECEKRWKEKAPALSVVFFLSLSKPCLREIVLKPCLWEVVLKPFQQSCSGSTIIRQSPDNSNALLGVWYPSSTGEGLFRWRKYAERYKSSTLTLQ